MNTNNVRTAIKVMQRVRYNEYPFSMEYWQQGKPRVTEQGAVNCGCVCCFAGWLVISPEGKRAGLSLNKYGKPRYNTTSEHGQNAEAIALYLDVPILIARDLVGIGGDNIENDVFVKSYYHKPLNDITSTDVIEALINILNNVTECFD